MPTVLVDKQPPIAVLTLNRPERLNAINAEMGRELREAWADLEHDDAVQAIVVTGAGKGFCSGLDVSERAADAPDPGERRGYDEAVRLTSVHNGVWKPVITAVNGACAGGGLHFVADSDVVICSEHAFFTDPHVSVGQVSALEPISLLRRIPFEVVVRMALLGSAERIMAPVALRCGMVSEVVEHDFLMERARELADTAARNSPAALAATKRAIWESLDMGLTPALRNGWRILQEHYQHPDVEEGPRAFVERREPRWAHRTARRTTT